MGVQSGANLTGVTMSSQSVRVPIFPIVVCVRSAYVIGPGVGFRVESGAVALLQLEDIHCTRRVLLVFTTGRHIN